MVLVTGAAGHVGCALVRELISDGEKVRALALPGEDLCGLKGLPVEIVEGNVLEPASIAPAIEGMETVYHLAGIISIMPGRDDLMRQVNVVGTANIARLARLAGARMVYVSSIHALGRPPRGTPIDENVAFDPHSFAGEYDRTKAEASLAVLSEIRYGLDAVIVCPTGIVGPYDYRNGSSMGSQIRQWMKPGMHVVIDGQFDFVDVRDVARGILLARRQGKRGQTYILSGERVSVAHLAAAVQDAAGVRGVHVKVPFRLALLASSFTTIHSRLWGTKVQFTRYALETLASNSLISSDKARRDLGYSPRGIDQTMRDTVKWLSEVRGSVDGASAKQSARSRGMRRLIGRGQVVPARRPGIAVVTGASSGIGAAVSNLLAGRGYRVLLVARRRERLQELASEIEARGGRAEIIAADLSRPEGVRSVYEQVMERGAGIDVLVNSAGFGWYGYASDMPAETAWGMIQVNNAALAQLIVLFLPLMRGRGYGRIINVSSVAGSIPSPWVALYSATKSFVDTMTTALHRELRGSGVHVCAIRPGPVLTEFYKTVARLSAGRSIPVERFAVQPQAVATRVMRLIRKPRRAVYVPRGLRLVPWIELGFGWLLDRVAVLFLRRQASSA